MHFCTKFLQCFILKISASAIMLGFSKFYVNTQCPYIHHNNYAHTNLQCFSTLLLSAIFSPTSVHTGWVSAILAKSAFTALTLPPVDSDPMLTINTSLRDSFCTCTIYTQNMYLGHA